jgi:hypothetical protein
MFNSAALTFMRSTQTGHMQDVAIRQAFSFTTNSMNEAVGAWDTTSTTEIPCGLDMRSGSERHGQNYTTLVFDASIRLPITTTIDTRDRIKITKRFGETLATALIFEIVGPIQSGPSGIRLLLKRIET